MNSQIGHYQREHHHEKLKKLKILAARPKWLLHLVRSRRTPKKCKGEVGRPFLTTSKNMLNPNEAWPKMASRTLIHRDFEHRLLIFLRVFLKKSA